MVIPFPFFAQSIGLCLQKGSYKVWLHFAEMQFPNDETHGSIGRHIFDGTQVSKRLGILVQINWTLELDFYEFCYFHLYGI